jgi:competence ComEA-like helix-hairpin-helix protein
MTRLHALRCAAAPWLGAAALWVLTVTARADPSGLPVDPAPVVHDLPLNEGARADPRPPCAPLANDSRDASAPGGKVDLNTADESALLDLPGIGPARARAILSYRATHGGFYSVSQLLQIRGIGRALLKQLRPLVSLSPVRPRAELAQPGASPR